MFESLEEIVSRCKDMNKNVYEVILEEEVKETGTSASLCFEKMKTMFLAMKQADEEYEKRLMSASGLVGGDGEKIRIAREANTLYVGSKVGKVMEKAIKMGESNACMKRIVAAPTAGACGVIPAVLLTMQEEDGYSDDQMTEALFVAAGIGGVIAHRAFIAGAAGGCQAEIGSASGMAAGAFVYLLGGNCEAIVQSTALALKNLLGLVCDPVAGLVEVPCVKRNVIGAVNAITSGDLALCQVYSKITPDDVIDAMRSIGRSMPEALRETGLGGLAATVSGQQAKEKIDQSL